MAHRRRGRSQATSACWTGIVDHVWTNRGRIVDQLWTRSGTQGWWIVSIARLPGISRSYRNLPVVKSREKFGLFKPYTSGNLYFHNQHDFERYHWTASVSARPAWETSEGLARPRDLFVRRHGTPLPGWWNGSGRSLSGPRPSAAFRCARAPGGKSGVRSYVLIRQRNPGLLELSEELVSRFEPGAQVYFVSGGSEGIETALKIARSYQLAAGRPARTQIAARSISYHGATLGALSATGLVKRRAPYEPVLAPVLRAATSYCYRCPFGLAQPSCDIACAADVESLVTRNKEELAAVLIEPVIGASAPGVVSPTRYLQRIAETACAKEDVLLIADEVLCGMGRTGRFPGCRT